MLTNGFFLLQCNVENFILLKISLLKYRQRKVDLNTTKKCLFSWQDDKESFIFTYSHCIRKFHIYARIPICGKMLLSYIIIWLNQKIWHFPKTETCKTNENIIFFVLFKNFHKKKILFFMQFPSFIFKW